MNILIGIVVGFALCVLLVRLVDAIRDVKINQTVHIEPAADDLIKNGLKAEDCRAYLVSVLDESGLGADSFDHEDIELLALRMQRTLRDWYDDGENLTAAITASDGRRLSVDWTMKPVGLPLGDESTTQEEPC